jgi:phytol kinase
MSPWLALLLSFAYVSTVIGVGEGLRRWLRLDTGFTRKFIHIAVGMYSLLTVHLFSERLWAVIPPLAFVLINWLDWKYGVVQAMTSSSRSNLGTVYFPIAFAAIVWFLWDRPALLVASLMPLTWGDALAAIVGERYGRHTYRVLGSTRSLEGSLTAFGVSALSTGLVLAGFGIPGAVGAALLTALGATLVEAVSPRGLDNLTIPAASALLLVWLVG